MRSTKYFGAISLPSWGDFRWQLQHSLRGVDDIAQVMPNLSDKYRQAIREYAQGFRISIPPYAFELVETPGDTIWRQFLPIPGLDDAARPDEFSVNQDDNWEADAEMVTPICHHKYTNRVCLRFPGCLGLCSFCLGAREVTSRCSKRTFNNEVWQQTLDWLQGNSQVEEVVLSGGDSLLLGDEKLDGCLRDLRMIEHVRFLRIHTRALTFVPMRISADLCSILEKHRVNAVHLDVAHPRELKTSEFRSAAAQLKHAVPHLRAHIPLLKGVNDDYDTLKGLCFDLYDQGIDPYYLIHTFPNTPLAGQHRLPVRRGIELMLMMKRHLTNPALPEYIFCHQSGKFTPPLTLEDSPICQFGHRDDGWPVVHIKNWRGEQVEYLDSP